MSGNTTDLSYALQARIELNRAQQGYGVAVYSVTTVNGAQVLSLIGTLTGQGDMYWISEWLAQGMVLQIQRVTVEGIPIPPPFSEEYGIPQSIDGA